MGGNESRDEGNVIIPETGAAKYWYVDPRARGVPSPGTAPVMPAAATEKIGLSQGDLDLISAVNRLLNPGQQPASDQSDLQGREREGGAVSPEEMEQLRRARQQDVRAILPGPNQMYLQDILGL